MPTKRCSMCRLFKDVSEFGVVQSRPDGYSCACKLCRKVRRREQNGVKTYYGTTERFWARVDMTGECWLWLGGADRRGYGRTTWPGKRHVRATHLVWFFTYGVWPTDWVLHHCDNPPCVRPEHLFEGTAADNVHDCIAKGRRNYFYDRPNAPRGKRHRWTRIPETTIETLRALHATGHYTYRELGRRFEIAETHVAHIIQRKARVHN